MSLGNEQKPTVINLSSYQSRKRQAVPNFSGESQEFQGLKVGYSPQSEIKKEIKTPLTVDNIDTTNKNFVKGEQTNIDWIFLINSFLKTLSKKQDSLAPLKQTIVSSENPHYSEFRIESKTTNDQFSEAESFSPMENRSANTASVLPDVTNPLVNTENVDKQSNGTKREQPMTEPYSQKEIDLMMENLSLRMDGRFTSLEALIKDGFQQNASEVKSLDHKIEVTQKDIEKNVAVLGTRIESLSTVVYSLLIPVLLALFAVMAPPAVDYFKSKISEKAEIQQPITSESTQKPISSSPKK